MNKVSVEQLKEILNDNIEIALTSKDVVCEIAPILSVVINENSVEFENKGYEVSFSNSDLKRRCRKIDTLLPYLKNKKVIMNGEAELVNISDRWKSCEEYTEYKKFCEITMEELLIRYKDTDIFSLTGRYNDGYSIEHPHGIYTIGDETAEKALKEISEWSLNMMKKQYERFTAEEKSSLPDFDNLVLDIQKECDDYFALVEAGNIPEGQSPFLADLIGDGKTKYKEPQGIWHFYHELYNNHMHYGQAIREMQKNTKTRELGHIFENPYYKELEECLIKTDVTFTWHCTTSSGLAVVYYFKMNEISRSWLCRLKSDYDMKELDDLAFYRNGKVIFSSCTHEHFHNCLL